VKQFKAEWEPKLKAEGCRIVLSNYLGQSVFLIRKTNVVSAETTSPNSMPKTNVGSPEPTSSQPTPQPNVVTTVTTSPQNIEEAIIQLIREGKTFKEIRESLGLSHAQLMGYMSSLRKKGVLHKIGWTPKRQKRKASTREAKVEPTEPSPNTSILKEMLEASLKLLDSHPRIAKFLLQKCMESLP
jgi:DNA-binding transcriptional ArsR family regulator